jgi:hypothetical protein
MNVRQYLRHLAGKPVLYELAVLQILSFSDCVEKPSYTKYVNSAVWQYWRAGSPYNMKVHRCSLFYV